MPIISQSIHKPKISPYFFVVFCAVLDEKLKVCFAHKKKIKKKVKTVEIITAKDKPLSHHRESKDSTQKLQRKTTPNSTISISCDYQPLIIDQLNLFLD
jgi:hypothetical protein